MQLRGRAPPESPKSRLTFTHPPPSPPPNHPTTINKSSPASQNFDQCSPKQYRGLSTSLPLAPVIPVHIRTTLSVPTVVPTTMSTLLINLSRIHLLSPNHRRLKRTETPAIGRLILSKCLRYAPVVKIVDAKGAVSTIVTQIVMGPSSAPIPLHAVDAQSATSTRFPRPTTIMISTSGCSSSSAFSTKNQALRPRALVPARLVFVNVNPAAVIPHLPSRAASHRPLPSMHRTSCLFPEI